MRTGLLAVLALGCASDGIGELGEPPVEVPVEDAEITGDRREVGVVEVGTERCTAVLVAPYAVLTSAPCLGSSETPRGFGTFSPGLGSGLGAAFVIDDARAVDGESEEGEAGGLVLAHLAQAVPASSAVPAHVSTEAPVVGEAVTRFGFDCLLHGPSDGSATKRKYFFAWGDDLGTCPSGVTFRGDGRIVQIDDGLLADVVESAAALRQQILDLPAPLEAGDDGGLLTWLRFDDGYVNGPVGMAASFDGTQVVERPRPLLTHRTSWTFSAWVRPMGMGGVLYSEGAPRPVLSIVLREDGGLAVESWHVADSSWASSTSTPGLVSLSEWSHIAISLDDGSYGGGKMKFYVNGQLVDVVDGRGSADPWTIYAAIGDNVGATNGGGLPHAAYTGELDEVRLHDRAISLALLRDLTGSAAP
jgi:hypothetical protein